MLYFVSTPIGNMGDITYRAVETLKNVDIIACEDTRHSLALLSRYDIKKELIAYHKFNEQKETERIIGLLESGKNVAVISDAGMPVISDPGNVLTKILAEKDIPFTVIPGANAALSALILSGLNAENFTFIGFLPDKLKDRDSLIKRYEAVPSTLIFYVAPHDVTGVLEYLSGKFSGRKAALVKEISKIHETVYRFIFGDNFALDNPKGEFVLIVEGQKEAKTGFEDLPVERHIKMYLDEGLSKKEAIKKVALDRGVSKNSLYKYTIDIE